jgi:C4-dicarboxylate-specific signal transduction histidine kinase
LIEDDGPGIGAEHRDRIFEPFFITKAPASDYGSPKNLSTDTWGSIEVHPRMEREARCKIVDVLFGRQRLEVVA